MNSGEAGAAESIDRVERERSFNCEMERRLLDSARFVLALDLALSGGRGTRTNRVPLQT